MEHLLIQYQNPLSHHHIGNHIHNGPLHRNLEKLVTNKSTNAQTYNQSIFTLILVEFPI